MARKKLERAEQTASVSKHESMETGPGSAGQSGDLQGLSDTEESESESVSELIEEGQFYEASLVDAIENGPGDGPLRPRKRAEDDLPPEYTDAVLDEPKE